MTDRTVRRGRLLVASVVVSAAVIVGALWLRAITIDETTARICDKVDALTAALVLAGTRDQPTTPAQQKRLDRFIDEAACDSENLHQLLKGVTT